MQGYKVIVYKENPNYTLYIEEFEEAERSHLARIEWYKDLVLLRMAQQEALK